MQSDAAQSDAYIKFIAWLQANQKRLILGAVIALAVIAVISFVVYEQGQKEVRASVALASVPVPISPAMPTRPGTAEAFLKVSREYDGTKAGARALVQAGAIYFTETKYAEAQKTFEQFLKDYPGSEWVPQAQFGVASSLDAQGKLAEATAKFEEIRRRFANDPIIDEVKLALGRLYENQNKPAEAHKIYSELVQLTQSNPYSGIGSEAGVRKEDLEAKHPELAPTNAPPTPQQLPPSVLTLTNPSSTTNRVITLSNMVRTVTNAAAATVTNVQRAITNAPLLLQPATNTAKP
jgi:predicted negative regulator of RcsB-dependent stress response